MPRDTKTHLKIKKKKAQLFCLKNGVFLVLVNVSYNTASDEV
jgi:hypothetical protein